MKKVSTKKVEYLLKFSKDLSTVYVPEKAEEKIFDWMPMETVGGYLFITPICNN